MKRIKNFISKITTKSELKHDYSSVPIEKSDDIINVEDRLIDRYNNLKNTKVLYSDDQLAVLYRVLKELYVESGITHPKDTTPEFFDLSTSIDPNSFLWSPVEGGISDIYDEKKTSMEAVHQLHEQLDAELESSLIGE